MPGGRFGFDRPSPLGESLDRGGWTTVDQTSPLGSRVLSRALDAKTQATIGEDYGISVVAMYRLAADGSEITPISGADGAPPRRPSRGPASRGRLRP